MISSMSLSCASYRCRITLNIDYHLTNCIIQSLQLSQNNTHRYRYHQQQINLALVHVLSNISIHLHKCRYYFPKYACRILTVNFNSILRCIYLDFLLGAQLPLSICHVPISVPKPTTHHKILQF